MKAIITPSEKKDVLQRALTCVILAPPGKYEMNASETFRAPKKSYVDNSS